ncbi:flagellar basal body rod protein FlgB [Phenylobacterium sp.]|uniref:flagellar basal body rod protein FlgB n=1 Tax=Phenylobacterium sp. TaxID=1871053 RepID=UPI002733C54C|nr:flagellar basal body rod protein FlgB [Phenylobacterium sp.]MDP3855909.1 flagellar basal body rod protein FlgB [Phenylobacterium sp.]
MNLAEIPLFSMLRGRLGHLSERQRVISQNVANSDTPGYTPSDLKAYSFEAQVKGVVMAPVQTVTQPGHMAAPTARKGLGSQFKSVKARDSETTLDGNSVVLEEEMLKMADARMSYDAAIGFYQKSLGLLRMASRAPGR